MMLSDYIRKHRLAVVFSIIVFLCSAEGLLHRHLEYLTIHCIQPISLLSVQSYYPHAAQYHNDVDNDRIQTEEVGQALNVYYMAGKYITGSDFKMRTDYYMADKYRILPAFISSLFVSTFTFKNSCLIANLIIWVIASISVWWISKRLFDAATGVIAGILMSTSYLMITLFTTYKGEMYQIAFYICLVALSLYLNHFSNEYTWKDYMNSFIVGTFAGAGMYASIATPYFLAFIFSYGLLSQKIRYFIKRNTIFSLGFLFVFILYKIMLQSSASVQFNTFSDFSAWWSCFKLKFINHFIYTVPLPLLIGAFGGVFKLNAYQAKIVLCMFSSLLVSEAIMYIAQGPNCFDWTISYYYLQVILPIYILNARFYKYLLFENNNVNKYISLVKKLTVSIFIIVNLFISNVGLFGNYYFYLLTARQIPVDMLLYSYFHFDNLDIYK